MRTWRQIRPGLLGLALLGVVVSVAAVDGQAAPRRPADVVATTGMIGDLAERLGGECFAVHTLMGPGVDPHQYRPAAQDVGRFQRAELILYNGFGLEGQLGSVLGRLGSMMPTLAVAEKAAEAADSAGHAGAVIRAGDKDSAPDPHLWMDVGLWRSAIDPVASQLGAVRPDCRDAIATRAAVLEQRFSALDQWIRQAVRSIPEPRRVLVTAHDAFAYYGRAYAIDVRGIQGVSTTAEAGVADIRDTAALLVERDVPAIFIESTINPRTVEAVRSAAASDGHEIALGGRLYGDALGEADGPAGDYLGMMRTNTRRIVEALGGRVVDEG